MRVKSALAGITGVALVVGIMLLGYHVIRGGQGRGDTNPYKYDIEQYRSVDPKLVRYLQAFAVEPGVDSPGALAVDSKDNIWVAGDGGVVVMDSAGRKMSSFRIGGTATCMAVDSETVFIGIGNRVEVYGKDGRVISKWESMGKNAVLTSIAVNGNSVCVADYGNRAVWRFDREGRLKGRLDGKDNERKIPGFVVPSPYFDVAFGRGGDLWIVNPGRHRVGRFAPDGKLISEWGVPSMEIEGFCGCCNPSHFAIAPDGSFVTAEKGLPRVKTFRADGTFRDVVAGAEHFGDSLPGCSGEGLIADIAVDSSGRVLVLDRKSNILRVFVRKADGDASG